LASGLGEVDGSFDIDVFKTNILTGAPIKGAVPEVAWTKTGTGFAAVGPGLMYAITPVTGVLLEAKPMIMFPTFGFGVGLQLGYTYGF
jgi:hypothetical protein